MRKYIFIFICFNILIINAQTPVLNIHTSNFAEIENAYYKDVDNFYNQYEGDWIYSDSEKTIKFRFVKKEMVLYQSNIDCYLDLLVGEIQYIHNGVELINSLNNVNNNYSSVFEYNLFSYSKTSRNLNDVNCQLCPKKYGVHMRYNEPQNDDVCLSADFIMSRFEENGIVKLKVIYKSDSGPCGFTDDWETPSNYPNFILPYGEYILIKQ